MGGRSELQFNIAYEDEGMQYDIAFSLALSQSLPSVEVLYPKILKLNTAIIEVTNTVKKQQLLKLQGQQYPQKTPPNEVLFTF